MRGMLRLVISALVASGLACAPAYTKVAPNPVDVRAVAAIDCTLRLTSDTMHDMVMMQDSAGTPEACRAACERYVQAVLIPMRDAMTILRYTCRLRDEVVADVDLKA